MKKTLLLINDYLLKFSLTVALLLVFCVRAQAQDAGIFPKEGSLFYTENGKAPSPKAPTRADNNVQWSFKSVIENCFDEKLLGKEAWMMTADGETQLKVSFEYRADDKSLLPPECRRNDCRLRKRRDEIRHERL